MGEKLSFKRPDGKACSGYYVEPATGSGAPGVVVIQEWWGLNDQIKGVANRLADADYRVLVPDLYRGKVAVETAEAEHLMKSLDFADAVTQDLRGAVQYLKEESPDVGVLGFCMGGVLSLLAAMHVPEADAVSSWYGIPPEEAGDPRTITIPLQGHFAEHDESFPLSQVDALEARLKPGQIGYDFYRYSAKHAFGNETGPNYEPKAAALAWQRTLIFLNKHLKGE